MECFFLVENSFHTVVNNFFFFGRLRKKKYMSIFFSLCIHLYKCTSHRRDIPNVIFSAERLFFQAGKIVFFFLKYRHPISLYHTF